jgi:hypothetical protein
VAGASPKRCLVIAAEGRKNPRPGALGARVPSAFVTLRRGGFSKAGQQGETRLDRLV